MSISKSCIEIDIYIGKALELLTGGKFDTFGDLLSNSTLFLFYFDDLFMS
jgi:hypothetical protein